jgi:hypothetical protein
MPKVEVLRSVENLDSHDPVVLSKVQHDLIRESAVGDLLPSIIEAKVG